MRCFSVFVLLAIGLIGCGDSNGNVTDQKQTVLTKERKMFTSKSETQIITIENDIKVVGLSLVKFVGHNKPETEVGKIGDLWGIYTGGQCEKVENVKTPSVNYGFWFMKPGFHDYIVGGEVVEFGQIDNQHITAVIPAGRYIKDSFNAKDFSDLVDGVLSARREVARKWADDNGIKIKHDFSVLGIEVYPSQEIAAEHPSMYTLTPVE